MITIKHQRVTAPENTQPLGDLEMSKLGGFGPKHISLHSLIKRTSIPAAQCCFWLCLSYDQKQGSQNYVATHRTKHFRPSRVDHSWHAWNGNAGVKHCVMKKLADSSYRAVQIKFPQIKKYSTRPSMIKDYVLWIWLGPTSSDESLGKRLSKNITKTNPQGVIWAKNEDAFLTSIQMILTLEWCWGLRLVIYHFIFIKTLQKNCNIANSWLFRDSFSSLQII